MFTRGQKVKLAARDQEIVEQQEEVDKISMQIQLQQDLRKAKQ